MLYQIDTDYGNLAEKQAVIHLQNHFKFPLFKLDYYNTFDFYNETEKVYIEIKSRRCKIDTYNSSMVGMNKLNKAKILSRKNYTIYFFFYFTNTDFSECDLYYWKFNILDFDNYIICKNGGRTDRLEQKEIKKYAYIPTNLLIKI